MSRKAAPSPARIVREVAPFLLLACACGAAAAGVPASAPATGMASAMPSASAQPAPASSESFDDLAAKGPVLAPGMHEAARRADGAEAIELWRAESGDACLRIAFASSVPVTARLLLKGGDVLAATSSPATEGALGEKGPVCVRKGDVVRGAVDVPEAHVRWLVWQAP